MRKFFTLLVLMLAAVAARADWAVRPSSAAAVAITVPASQGGYCSLVVRQNNPASATSTAYTIWVGAVLSGGGTAVPAGQSYVFPCVAGQTFAGGTVVGWIQTAAAGPFGFAVVGRYPPPSTTASNGYIFKGTLTMSGAVASASSSTFTVAVPGATSSTICTGSFNGAWIGIVGFIPSTGGMLSVGGYPTAGNCNFTVVNNTAASITLGSTTLNVVAF